MGLVVSKEFQGHSMQDFGKSSRHDEKLGFAWDWTVSGTCSD